jgi:GMP synthase (glutamine-hydrolysing)
MMTGSPLSVTQPEPWMQRAADFMVEAGEKGTPVLGVCFGQQLLAHAYGGKVSRNLQGREIGTVEVSLTEAGRKDPLFDGLPERFAVQATHEDIVSQLPEGAQVLAGNANTAAQALAFRPNVRGVPVHPEAPTDAMRALIHARQ